MLLPEITGAVNRVQMGRRGCDDEKETDRVWIT